VIISPIPSRIFNMLIAKYHLDTFDVEKQFMKNIEDTNSNSVLTFNNKHSCSSFADYFSSIHSKGGSIFTFKKRRRIKTRIKSRRRIKRKRTCKVK
jgi:hypothetical protein